jgi:FMN phosphatase YigB (HAD superfamily)
VVGVIVGREPVESALASALVELDWPLEVDTLLRTWFEADFEIEHEVVRAVKSDPACYPAAERRLGVGGPGQAIVFVDDSHDNVDRADTHGWSGVHCIKQSDRRTRIESALDGRTGRPPPPSCGKVVEEAPAITEWPGRRRT